MRVKCFLVTFIIKKFPFYQLAKYLRLNFAAERTSVKSNYIKYIVTVLALKFCKRG